MKGSPTEGNVTSMAGTTREGGLEGQCKDCKRPCDKGKNYCEKCSNNFYWPCSGCKKIEYVPSKITPLHCVNCEHKPECYVKDANVKQCKRCRIKEDKNVNPVIKNGLCQDCTQYACPTCQTLCKPTVAFFNYCSAKCLNGRARNCKYCKEICDKEGVCGRCKELLKDVPFGIALGGLMNCGGCDKEMLAGFKCESIYCSNDCLTIAQAREKIKKTEGKIQRTQVKLEVLKLALKETLERK